MNSTSAAASESVSELKLEPCPFCGGVGRIVGVGAWNKCSAVYCDNCEIYGPMMATKETAAFAWNRRSLRRAEVEPYCVCGMGGPSGARHFEHCKRFKSDAPTPAPPVNHRVEVTESGGIFRSARSVMTAPLGLSPAPPVEVVKRWPFVESPGEFADRLTDALNAFDGYVLGAVRNVLIENPPTLSLPTAKADGWVAWKPGDALPKYGQYVVQMQNGDRQLAISGISTWYGSFMIAAGEVAAYLPTPLPPPYTPPSAASAGVTP